MSEIQSTKMYVVQGDYGQGWEDATGADTREEAESFLRDYRESQPQYSHRLITRPVTRKLYDVASEIERDWGTQGRGVNYAARPYLDAMRMLSSVTDSYYYDSGASVVRYFLANATTWRGETARRVKAELRSMLKAAGK